MGAVQGKSSLPLNQQKPRLTNRFNPLTGRYDSYDINNQRFVSPQERQSQTTIFQQTQQIQTINQQRQAAVAAQQKAEKRVGELEKELQGFRDIAEGKGDVGFRTPTRTVSTAGSMGGNLRIGDRSGSRSRRAIRARSRGVSQLSTG